ncbi:NAD-P-binding protein [Vararia minispora EC-137]|uniref:NAD-P-binding protein n=1 Tax=Vararia minispora EC-137 TaxID=1314806 RepID=A0ACB8QAV3_9AGAM|nr:NAD-P-binding protein [Vararia minispora EC-137]
MDLDLGGVHVLVTGANGGIGFETTRVFLEQGAFVTAQYRNSNATLLPLTARYDESRLRLTQADLTSEPAVAELFATVPRTVEVLIVNHAVYSGKSMVKDMTLGRWRDTFENNLTSSFLVIREYMRKLERGIAINEDKGRFGDRAAVVLIGSTAGKFGETFNADYSATKSAMMYGLTLSLKNEIVMIAPHGRVNCIAPGWVKTPMATEALTDPSVVYQALATTPLKKIAEPSDIAQQIAVLASAKVSGHISGQIVMIAGGMEGRLLNHPQDLNLPLNA